MLNSKDCLGKVVYSKAGRDEGKAFIVLSTLDDKYLYICDGSLRTVEKPKKKKVRHLIFTNMVSEEIRCLLLSDGNVNDSMIKKFLQSYDNNKEV